MLREEGGENPVFETYCSPFEDHLGDQYDWVDETVTQKYLCRLLYTYYTPEVSLDVSSSMCLCVRMHRRESGAQRVNNHSK